VNHNVTLDSAQSGVNKNKKIHLIQHKPVNINYYSCRIQFIISSPDPPNPEGIWTAGGRLRNIGVRYTAGGGRK
jgi:hypothetical protein